MTTPNLPWDTTDPSDLPQGVIAPSQAGTALQDQSQQKFTDVAASKFPAIASNTAAGSPSGGGVMGFVVSKFSQITSNVANADPATINKPDDVVNLAGNFFSGLPLVSFIGDIVGAITGIVGGGFATLGTFFSQAWDALQGIASFGPISGIISNLFGHQVAVNNSILSISAEQVQANTRLDALETFAGTGVTTPLWESTGGKDISTFPDTLMQTSNYADSSVSSVTISQTTAQANVPHNHTASVFKSDSTRGTYAPAFTPGKGGVDFGFIRGGLDTDVPIELARIITGTDASPLGIDAWYIGIYVYDAPNSRMAKIWDSGDIKNVLTSQRQRYNIATGLTNAKAKPDQLLAVASLQVAPGVFQTPRSVGCIFQTGISEPPGVTPQARAAYLNVTATSLPQYVAMSDLVWDKTKLLWASLGPVSA